MIGAIPKEQRPIECFSHNNITKSKQSYAKQVRGDEGRGEGKGRKRERGRERGEGSESESERDEIKLIINTIGRGKARLQQYGAWLARRGGQR